MISVAPRLVIGLDGDWVDTTLELASGSWHNLLTGDRSDGGAVRLDAILSRFPVGLLVKEDA